MIKNTGNNFAHHIYASSGGSEISVRDPNDFVHETFGCRVSTEPLSSSLESRFSRTGDLFQPFPCSDDSQFVEEREYPLDTSFGMFALFCLFSPPLGFSDDHERQFPPQFPPDFR